MDGKENKEENKSRCNKIKKFSKLSINYWAPIGDSRSADMGMLKKNEISIIQRKYLAQVWPQIMNIHFAFVFDVDLVLWLLWRLFNAAVVR